MEFGNVSVVGWGFGAAVPVATTKVFIVGTTATSGNGAFLTGAGVWTNISTRDKKDNFTELDKSEVLEKIGRMEVSKWRYKGSNEYHIGPIAENFYDLFAVGVDNKSISTIDPAGVALIGVQALKVENDALKLENSNLKKMMEELAKRVELLEKK
jgi:hypothetical protein